MDIFLSFYESSRDINLINKYSPLRTPYTFIGIRNAFGLANWPHVHIIIWLPVKDAVHNKKRTHHHYHTAPTHMDMAHMRIRAPAFAKSMFVFHLAYTLFTHLTHIYPPTQGYVPYISTHASETLEYVKIKGCKKNHTWL